MDPKEGSVLEYKIDKNQVNDLISEERPIY